MPTPMSSAPVAARDGQDRDRRPERDEAQRTGEGDQRESGHEAGAARATSGLLEANASGVEPGPLGDQPAVLDTRCLENEHAGDPAKLLEDPTSGRRRGRRGPLHAVVATEAPAHWIFTSY